MMNEAKSGVRTNRFYLMGVVAVFLVTRSLFFLLGVRFDMSYFGRAWQLVDPLLLRESLFQSIWYLHSQPPLFNLWIGGVLTFFPAVYPYVFHVFYVLLGCILALSMYSVLNRFGVTKRTSFFVTVLFILSPSVVLFENLFFYDYAILVIFFCSLFSLQLFAEHGKSFYLHTFFWLLATLALSRSLFHVAWFVVFWILVLFFYKQEWKKVLFAGLIPFFLIFGWYAKNYHYFGNFGASSWMGMGLYKTTMFLAGDEERQSLVEDGIVEKLYNDDPFTTDLSDYVLPDDIARQFEDVPIVVKMTKSNNTVNYNHYAYVELSNTMLAQVKQILVHRPSMYFKSTLGTAIIFFAPASNYLSSNLNAPYANYESIKWLARPYEWFVYGEPLAFVGNARVYSWSENVGVSAGELWRVLSIGVLVVASYLFSIIYTLYILVKNRKRLQEDKKQYLIFAYLLLNMAYITLVGIFFEAGENQRHRFMIEPFCWVVCTVALERMITAYRNKRGL